MVLHVEFGSPLPAFTIEGERYDLRPFRHDDLPLIEEASTDSFIPVLTTVPAEFTFEAGIAFIDRQNFRLSSGAGWSLAIVDCNQQRPVGQIGLWIPQLHKGRAEIGYWIAESGRGNGAAAQAVPLLSEWAFANLDVSRLSLFIEPWNEASIRTAEQAGYEREGLLRDWERVDGIAKDMWSYYLGRPS